MAGDKSKKSRETITLEEDEDEIDLIGHDSLAEESDSDKTTDSETSEPAAGPVTPLNTIKKRKRGGKSKGKEPGV